MLISAAMHPSTDYNPAQPMMAGASAADISFLNQSLQSILGNSAMAPALAMNTAGNAADGGTPSALAHDSAVAFSPGEHAAYLEVLQMAGIGQSDGVGVSGDSALH